MRLSIYIGVAVLLLVSASYFNQPIQKYLSRIKSETNATQRQTEIVKVDTRSTTLQKQMVDLKTVNPAASQVHVSMVHSSISPEGNNILQYDTIAAVATPGLVTGPLSANLPLANWSDYLRTLLVHDCVTMKTNTMINEVEKARLMASNIALVAACPILNKKGQLLGGVFANYNRLEDVPTNLSQTMDSLRNSAKTIAPLMPD